MANKPFVLRTARREDAAELSALGRRTFIESFGYLYSQKNLDDFLGGVYAPRLQEDEITYPGNHIMLAFAEGKMVGYAKSGPCKLPVEHPPQPAYELHRLYIGQEAQGMGIGKALIEDALDFFRHKKAASVYVGVWQENHRAQGLYRSFGFEQAGHYFFTVGEHRDDELILKMQNWSLPITQNS